MGDKSIRPTSGGEGVPGGECETELAVLTPPGGVRVTQATVSGLEDERTAWAPGRCVCGHGRTVHEHYRHGSDCGICGAAKCAAYRRSG
jgi:hypothetical protein